MERCVIDRTRTLPRVGAKEFPEREDEDVENVVWRGFNHRQRSIVIEISSGGIDLIEEKLELKLS